MVVCDAAGSRTMRQNGHTYEAPLFSTSSAGALRHCFCCVRRLQLIYRLHRSQRRWSTAELCRRHRQRQPRGAAVCDGARQEMHGAHLTVAVRPGPCVDEIERDEGL
jgi:hypothetical protein